MLKMPQRKTKSRQMSWQVFLCGRSDCSENPHEFVCFLHGPVEIAGPFEYLRFRNEPKPIMRFSCLLQCNGYFANEVCFALSGLCFLDVGSNRSAAL